MPAKQPDMSDRLFSWQGGKQHHQPGSDVEQQVAVTLQEAYCGTTRWLTLTLPTGQTRQMELEIPPGVDTGTRVRFAGYGKRGQAGSSPGDLYLRIEVRQHPRFARQGDDLSHVCSANLVELALGGQVRIKTVDERMLSLTIPAGTLPDQRFRLAGEGMPRLRRPDQRGDLLVTVNAKIPPNLQKLLEKLRRSQAPHAPTPQEDVITGLVIIAVTFVAGIGAGLLLWWLILD
jgi:curved DNA-binding protein